MHMSASQVVANYLAKTQVNNFLNHSPTKSQYASSSENFRDFLHKPPLPSGASTQAYSPDLEGLRREMNDQIRNHFYSLSSDVTGLKKENSEYKFQIDELRRELESTNTKLLQYKSSQISEIQNLKDIIFNDKDAKSFRGDESLKSSWNRGDKRIDDVSGNINPINDKLHQMSRQIQFLNNEVENLKKPVYISRDQFSRSMSDVIDELERKLKTINDRVRERIEEMDISLVRSNNEKEKEFNKVNSEIKNLHASMRKVNDQVGDLERSLDSTIENQVIKIINGYSYDMKPLSTVHTNTDHRSKTTKKDEVLGLSPRSQARDFESKMRELDSVYKTIGLLEKEMRSKIDMVDLNINSIKRNLELDLSIQLKHMVLPVQKNMEQYLQNTESRFSALEDAVLNHMKRDSYIMTAERASRLRGSSSLEPRGSNMMEDHLNFSHKPGFSNNISIIEGHGQDRKGSFPDNRLGTTSGHKDKGKEKDRFASEAFTIDEVHSVLSVNETTSKGDGRHSRTDDGRSEQKSGYSPSGHKPGTFQDEVNYEEEPLATNSVKPIASDKDTSKNQSSSQGFFRNLDAQDPPETLFKDFPSTCAMKTHLEMEHPDNKIQDKTLKKKKPEIDVNEAGKGSGRDSGKKPAAKNSPLGMGSKLTLNQNVYNNDDGEEEEQIPAPRKNVIDNNKNIGSKAKEIADSLVEEANEDYSGNIKGLLRKSRNKKDNQIPVEEEDHSNKMKGSQKVRFEDQTPPMYGKEPVQDTFKKNNTLANKNLDKGKDMSKPADTLKKNQKELPPVDAKNMKGLNKKDLAPIQPQYGQGYGKNNMQNPGPHQKGAPYPGQQAWDMGEDAGEEEEEESVEEIVYQVDEDGFLIDEQGNYLVDENGNFLQLSPDQMKDIEEKDLVYEKEV